MELLTFSQLKEDLDLLKTKLWHYIDGRYAFKPGYRRYPFRGVLMEEITGQEEYIARIQVFVEYRSETLEFIYLIGRRYTIQVMGPHVDPFAPRGTTMNLSWDIRMPIIDWMEQINTNASKRRCHQRVALLKEEIAAAAWAPARVERWVTAGGPDILDSL